MDFWKEKNVLVTGHTGFKGSWLCELLLARGCRVYGLALQPHTRPSLFMQLDLQKRIDHFVCDVQNFQGVSDRVIAVQPDVVIHMAAQALVRRSYIEPVLTLSTNLMGTVSLLESLRKLECRCAVVIVTTDKVYKDINEDQPKVETDQLGGHDPYSASKAAVELLVDSYRRSFFGVEAKLAGGGRDKISIATARSGNVVGGGDWAEERLIPDVVRSLLNDETLRVRNPSSIRPWQHVLEPLNGYLELARCMYESDDSVFQQSFNFGPEPEPDFTVGEVIDKFLTYWGRNLVPAIEKNGPHETSRLSLNIDRAVKMINWKPRWDIDRTLIETANWYRDVHFGPDSRGITRSQISSYEAES